MRDNYDQRSIFFFFLLKADLKTGWSILLPLFIPASTRFYLKAKKWPWQPNLNLHIENPGAEIASLSCWTSFGIRLHNRWYGCQSKLTLTTDPKSCKWPIAFPEIANFGDLVWPFIYRSLQQKRFLKHDISILLRISMEVRLLSPKLRVVRWVNFIPLINSRIFSWLPFPKYQLVYGVGVTRLAILWWQAEQTTIAL